MVYAANTSVTVERSRAELDRLLAKHGAEQRLMGQDDSGGVAFCMFSIAKRQVRLRVPVPTSVEVMTRVKGKQERAPHGWGYWTEFRRLEWCKARAEQLARERWRALVLLVKAKLELVELGLSTVEREFLADIYLPNGRTVHEEIESKISQSYLDGKMPKLLGMGEP